MSIPRKHHYLPEFYLDRWAIDGELYRYVRPQGPDGPVNCKKKTPGGVAYEKDLYRLTDVEDLKNSQAVEIEVFGTVDHQAAIAFQKLEDDITGNATDRIAMSRFMISLLHRSPSRLKALRAELAERTDGAPYEGLTGEDYEKTLTATTNRLLAELVGSKRGIKTVSKFRVFKIDTSAATRKLLTSDQPMTISNQLVASEAFMLMPYAPDRLVLLTHKEEIADAFSSQNMDTLVAGVNEAIVEQSQDMIIASDKRARPMVEKYFMHPKKEHEVDSIGLIRRRSPWTDLRPATRKFSRHDKRSMGYL